MRPADLTGGNLLPEDEALEAAEVAMTRVLTGALQMNVNVTITDQLLITAYPEAGDPITLSLNEINHKLRRHLLHQIDLELQKRRTLSEAERLKQLRGNTAPGEILRITDDGSLFVSLEIADCYRRLVLGGVCPPRFQPLHERHSYKIGSVRVFYITSVLPVMVNGKSPRVMILLSRMSKELPRLLLQERSRIAGIQCCRRIAGGYSDIVTPQRIPKDVINSVGKELGEHLNVSILKTER